VNNSLLKHSGSVCSYCRRPKRKETSRPFFLGFRFSWCRRSSYYRFRFLFILECLPVGRQVGNNNKFPFFHFSILPLFQSINNHFIPFNSKSKIRGEAHTFQHHFQAGVIVASGEAVGNGLLATDDEIHTVPPFQFLYNLFK